MIDGVMIRDLVTHADEHGYLYEMLRADWPEFKTFGQLYATITYPGVIKGWHFHKLQTDHFIVTSGMAKIALYDNRPDSPTRHELMEVTIGEHRQRLVVIPPFVLHGVVALNQQPITLINIPDYKYDYKNPDEQRVPFDIVLQYKDGTEGPYKWFAPTEDAKHK